MMMMMLSLVSTYMNDDDACVCVCLYERRRRRSCQSNQSILSLSLVYIGTPRELSSWEILVGLHHKALGLAPMIGRGIIISFLWLLVLPFYTSMVFQVR